ncbi:hypothetical protein Tco_0370631 [Tanacetum coccineum]
MIHVEYSLDDISNTETPIVIEEDGRLMVEATTKLQKVQTEDNSIMPEEATSKDSLLKEIQYQIVHVSQDKSDNVMSLPRHSTITATASTFTTTDETKGSNLGCHRKSKLSSEEKNQLLHKKKVIGFPTHWSCASPLHNSFDTHDLIRVVPTYYQDEDDQDAQHQAIQDDNPTITELVEYSRDDISKQRHP